jgi:hypothetical protein
VDQPHTRSRRFAWLRLNADTLFLALLAIGSGVFDLFNPSLNPVVITAPANLYAYYLRCGGYVVSGLMLLVALALMSIHWEVIARFILLGAVAFQVWRRWAELGLSSRFTAEVIVLFTILAITTFLRVTALFSRHGIAFTIPAVRPDEVEEMRRS